ncbi:MAG: flippase [Bacteroidota bacterium]
MSNQKSNWLKSGKFALLERVLMLGFGILTFYMLVRVLDKYNYGSWMLFMTITTLVDVLRNGFFKNPLIKFFNSSDDHEKDSIQSTSLTLNILFSIVITLIIIALAGPISLAWDVKELIDLLIIYFFMNICLSFFFHFDYITKANFRFDASMVAQFVKRTLFFLFIGYFFISGKRPELVSLGIGLALCTLVSTLVLFIYYSKFSKLNFRIQKKWAKELFHYGKYTLGTNLSAVLLRNIDVWMIGAFINPAAVATYNVAMRIANLFEVPTMAMASIIFPEMVSKVKLDGEKAIRPIYEKSVAIIILLTVPFILIVIIFSSDIVYLLAGEGYSETSPVLQITIFLGMFIPFTKQMGVVLDAVGKASLNMKFVILAAIINVILNVIAIPTYGIIGAASATLTTMFITAVIALVYLNKTHEVKISSILLEVKSNALKFPNLISEKLLSKK